MTQHLFRKQHVVASVVALIVDADDRVVLTRRAVAPFLDQWVMPGGKIGVGEPILQALQREVREEVGLEVAVEGLVDVFEHLGPDTDHFLILYYRCRPMKLELWPNAAEVAEARWVPRSELDAIPTTDGTRFILGRVFPEHRTKGARNLKG
jgi:8-oxo-dGTP diphosphatase